MKTFSAWIGFDPRETAAFDVARESLRQNLQRHTPINGVVLNSLQKQGLYTRRTDKRLGKLWDVISEAPMSTEFAISRFFVPYLAGSGFALFMDCDMLVRKHVGPLLTKLDPAKALYCVKHNHVPKQDVKMDGQEQTKYPRKNWSSFMIFNCDHPANDRLTLDLLNGVPGRDLHRFCWLDDSEIGELEPTWNYLVGHTEGVEDPAVVHYTDGGPWFTGFEDVEYADEWRQALYRHAA